MITNIPRTNSTHPLLLLNNNENGVAKKAKKLKNTKRFTVDNWGGRKNAAAGAGTHWSSALVENFYLLTPTKYKPVPHPLTCKPRSQTLNQSWELGRSAAPFSEVVWPQIVYLIFCFLEYF